MAKVLINGILKNNEDIINFETKGILDTEKNILMYNFDSVKNTIYINENILKRENDDSIIILNFDKNSNSESKLFLKDTTLKIMLNLITLNIEKSSGKYMVEYALEGDQKIEYRIKYKII